MEDDHLFGDAGGEEEVEGEILALALICWNCQREGHRCKDCLADLNVFCLANTYKPNCSKCSSKNRDADAEVFACSTAASYPSPSLISSLDCTENETKAA